MVDRLNIIVHCAGLQFGTIGSGSVWESCAGGVVGTGLFFASPRAVCAFNGNLDDQVMSSDEPALFIFLRNNDEDDEESSTFFHLAEQ